MSLPQRSTSRKFYDIVIITILSGFLLFSCSFSESNMSFAYAASIVLFEDVQFKGIKSTLRVEDSSACVNLVGKLNDFYSSVNTMGVCFKLCEHLNCNGKCEQVRGKLGDLSVVGLNDLVSSITLCEDEKTKTLNNALSRSSTSHPPVPVKKARVKRDVNVNAQHTRNTWVEKRRGTSLQPKPSRRNPSSTSTTTTQESETRTRRIPVPVQTFLGLRELLRAAAASMSTIFQAKDGKGHIFSSNSQSKDSTSKGNQVENYHRQRISSSSPSRTTQSTTLSSSSPSTTHLRRKRRRLVVNHVREQHQKQ